MSVGRWITKSRAIDLPFRQVVDFVECDVKGTMDYGRKKAGIFCYMKGRAVNCPPLRFVHFPGSGSLGEVFVGEQMGLLTSH